MESEKCIGQCDLVEKVINKGICVACGACVGLCPYFQYYDGKVVVMDECHSETGRCYQFCPRIEEEMPHPEEKSGQEVRSEPIGIYKEILIVRAKDEEIRDRAQYGGTISALLIHAMDKGLIESAVLTDRGNGLSPVGFLAGNESDILACAGSRYSGSGGLASLNQAIKDNREKLSVVGLPCQMEALARMKTMEQDGELRENRINLRLGLFCTWALDYRKLSSFLKNQGFKQDIKKYDIPPPPSEIFQLQTEEGTKEIPLSEIRPFVQKGCALCEDMTAEKADISVGTAEGMDGWNTVVVRSALGKDLLSSAIEEGRVQSGPLPEENLRHLEEASKNKRERGRLAKKDLSSLCSQLE